MTPNLRLLSLIIFLPLSGSECTVPGRELLSVGTHEATRFVSMQPQEDNYRGLHYHLDTRGYIKLWMEGGSVWDTTEQQDMNTSAPVWPSVREMISLQSPAFCVAVITSKPPHGATAALARSCTGKHRSVSVLSA